MRVTLTVNGERRTADDVWEGESLLFVLRDRLQLPGSKNACEQGECGSCTVQLDGRRSARAWSRPARRRVAR
jgi:carbon-monoxide dehydrogenase small subunit